ncbi:protein FAM200B-like [Latimeria chalumnae]|uniref:protein FAM200B-like n=1 Tax=Latimeria chalumnae TaxID=7897 RepID=UPI00313BB4A8
MYDPAYLKFGFSFIEDRKGEHRPQCIICGELLANESLKPSKLRRHLETKHPTYKDKPLDFFKRKSKYLEISQKTLERVCTVQEQALRASYLVANRIVKCKKAHTVAEELILPSAIDMCTELLGESAAKKLKTIPLSNDTIRRRICGISEDIKLQTTDRLSVTDCFVLQLDESTDVSNHAILLVYVRHVWESDFQEQYLFSADLPTSTTAADIFAALDNYFESVGLSWSKCVDVTTDGAASMTGKHSGVVQRILSKAPNATWNHCFLHREALAAKDMVPEVHETLKDVVKIVNYIKQNAKNSQCFQVFCQEMGNEHVHLLYHAEVRWLSRGKVLSRVYELKSELAAFLEEKKSHLAEHFNNNTWLARVAYLADIFDQLNDLNLSLQGRGHNRFEQSDKIAAFKKKLSVEQTCFKK